VEVKRPAAILATLDERGRLEELPFMPEMARRCGRRYVVDRRAERICDTVHYTGARRPDRTVFLDDLRCDGSAHGGCQAECRLLWKEEWLEKIAPDAPPPPAIEAGEMEELLARIAPHVRAEDAGEGGPRACWSCQATALPQATRLLGVWDPRSYVREYTTGNVRLGRFLRVSARAAVQEPMDKLGLMPRVHVPGTRTAPAADPPLNLQPGELVQVRSREEIAATLTPDGKHRGLWFDREMAAFCGRTLRVRRRVERIIDERNGRMIQLKNDCVTLEGGVCSGDLSLQRWFCPREIYSYWRECWLRRVDQPGQAAGTVAAAAPDSTACGAAPCASRSGEAPDVSLQVTIP
jgi:hypothetical protein